MVKRRKNPLTILFIIKDSLSFILFSTGRHLFIDFRSEIKSNLFLFRLVYLYLTNCLSLVNNPTSSIIISVQLNIFLFHLCLA